MLIPVDTFDLYHANARANYVARAAAELRLKEETVKADLGRMLLKREMLQGHASVRDGRTPKTNLFRDAKQWKLASGKILSVMRAISRESLPDKGKRPARGECASRQTDLGLYYYKARMYSPGLGRFLQTDPIGTKDDLNWYAYVGNNPITSLIRWGCKPAQTAT